VNTNELVDQLDAVHGKTWNLWRAALGHWCVQIRLSDGKTETLDAPDLEAALLAAIAWRDLPIIPYRPHPIYDIAPVKDGSKWRLLADGRDAGGNIPTKTRALELAELRKSQAAKACADWDEKYGAASRGVVGVDFRYGGAA
jgi:hypothetical protein